MKERISRLNTFLLTISAFYVYVRVCNRRMCIYGVNPIIGMYTFYDFTI